MERIEDIIKLIEAKEEQNSGNLLFKYLKHWLWFIAFCIVGIITGYLIFRNTPNTYQITSRILVKSEPKELSSVLAFNNSMAAMDKRSLIVNQIGLLKSYTLYRKALENLNWDFSWYQKKFMYNSDLYKNHPFDLTFEPDAINAKNVPVQIRMISENEYSIKAKGETYMKGYAQSIDFEKKVKFGEPLINEFFNFTLKKGVVEMDVPYVLLFNNLDKMTSDYMSKTSIYSEEENSDIIIIMIEGEERQREADFINELNKVFIEYGMENKYASSENSLNFIDSQLERLKISLKTAEENFSNYRKNSQVMDMGQEAQNVSGNLQQIEQELYLTQLQIDFYNNLQKYLDDANKIEEIVNPSVIGITDPNLNGLLSKLMELYSRREVLSYSVQDKNPALLVLEKEIKVARDALGETLKNQMIATQSKMESINERHSAIQQRLKKLPETEKQMIGIQRDFDLNNEMYTYMLQKKTESSISKASIAPEVQVIDSAIVEAAKQTGPNLILNLAIGLMGGAGVPFIFITFLIVFNNKIETLKEIENESKIPVFEGIMKHKYKVKLPVIHYPRSGIAESFRGLKTNINTKLEGTESKVISINSLIPGEGKSFISSNLSAVIAKTNKKVLLIGADLHKPTLHDFLEVNKSCGLGDYLKNEKSIEEIITLTSIPNLYLIQTGTVPENPSDLMESTKFEKLIEQTRKMFDYIIIDNAPLLLIPDAILTSQFSDISLFILRINFSHKEQIKKINKVVDFNKIESAAIILNDVHGSGYGYGYGKKYWKNGYGEYKNKKGIAGI